MTNAQDEKKNPSKALDRDSTLSPQQLKHELAPVIAILEHATRIIGSPERVQEILFKSIERLRRLAHLETNAEVENPQVSASLRELLTTHHDIFLVENNPWIVDDWQKECQERNLKLWTAASTQDTLKILTTNCLPTSCPIFIDLELEKSNGLDLARDLKTKGFDNLCLISGHSVSSGNSHLAPEGPFRWILGKMDVWKSL